MVQTYTTRRKLFQIAFAAFFCLTCAGVVFGFAALKPVLVAQGVYDELCRPGEKVRDPETGFWRVCKNQDIKLNYMFTLSTAALNIATLPIGYTLDKLGPRKTSLMGATSFLIGNFLFGLQYQGFIDTYIVGFIFIALGGPLIFLPSFHLSNAFPAYSGLILSAMTGAFDASSIPYVFYRSAYQKFGDVINIRVFFWCYCIIPCIVIIEQIFVAPGETFQRETAVSLDEVDEALEDAGEPRDGALIATMPASLDQEITTATSSIIHLAQNLNLSQMNINNSTFSRIHAYDDEQTAVKEITHDRLTGIMYGREPGEQIRSKWFWLLAAFLCIHMARINFYILSCYKQLEFYTGDSALAEKLTVAFTILLPIGGLVGVPFVGLLLDRRPFKDTIFVCFLLGLAFGVLGMTHHAVTQIIAISFFVFFRPLMYTAMSDGFAKIFGFKNFGTVYGLGMTLSGMTGLLNAPLDMLVKNRLDGNFLPVSITLLCLGAVTSLTLYGNVWAATREGAIELDDEEEE